MIAFTTPAEWNAWLAQNPAATEVWVLYHRKGSGIASITWEQAVIEALAYGWIDGLRKSVDDTRWAQRFTPRRAGSVWSARNIAHAARLIAEGRMTPAGMAQVEIGRANGRWDAAYAGGKDAQMPQDFLEAVGAVPAAAAGLARLNAANRFAIYYRLTTAKRAETRAKRMADFITKLRLSQDIV